ncbi:MAG: hypothetical protein EXR71_14595 [Myxococcales bacterium]|nr:hypothetical protein [Myxococcales bacterium]
MGGAYRSGVRACTAVGGGEWRCPAAEGDRVDAILRARHAPSVSVLPDTTEVLLKLEPPAAQVCLDVGGRTDCLVVTEP